jgi:hypothetical protein
MADILGASSEDGVSQVIVRADEPRHDDFPTAVDKRLDIGVSSCHVGAGTNVRYPVVPHNQRARRKNVFLGVDGYDDCISYKGGYIRSPLSP